MGNKIRNYSIFVLFLLMSMSVFAGKPAWAGGGNPTTATITINGVKDFKYVKGSNPEFSNINGNGNDITEINSAILTNGILRIVFTGKNKAKTIYVYKDLESEGEKVENYTYNLTSKIEKVCLDFEIQTNLSGKAAGGGGQASHIKLNLTVVPSESSVEFDIKTYEELDPKDQENPDNQVIMSYDGYKFTKGGPRSYVTNPAIYVFVPETDDSGNQIVGIKVEKLNGTKAEETFELSDESGYITINSVNGQKFTEGSNKVEVTTIINKAAGTIESGKQYRYRNGAGWVIETTGTTKSNGNGYAYGHANKKTGDIDIETKDGTSKTLNFVVDTQVNDTYLGSGIIGELDRDGKIVVDLTSLMELSGITGYSYKFKVGEEKKLDNESVLNVKSSTTLAENSVIKTLKFGDGKVKIQTFGFIPGSKGTLSFTVYDKLGHEKTFEKTYFIPTESSGVTSKIEGEVKQRNSRIKIVTEGNKDKFGIGSNISGSSEGEPN